MQDYKRLLKNIVALGIITLLVVSGYYLYTRERGKTSTIDETGIKVESIKNIAEISTISYKDEIVVDTVEYFKDEPDLLNPLDWRDLYDKTMNRDVKRRLTLIIRGEVRYGVDLTDQNYHIEQNEDSIWLTLPNSEVLDVIITPSLTEVFEEQGEWSDGTRKLLEAKALHKLKTNAESFGLRERANENIELLFSKLLPSKKKLIIDFE